jgi:hypothetical protein
LINKEYETILGKSSNGIVANAGMTSSRIVMDDVDIVTCKECQLPFVKNQFCKHIPCNGKPDEKTRKTLVPPFSNITISTVTPTTTTPSSILKKKRGLEKKEVVTKKVKGSQD